MKMQKIHFFCELENSAIFIKASGFAVTPDIRDSIKAVSGDLLLI